MKSKLKDMFGDDWQEKVKEKVGDIQDFWIAVGAKTVRFTMIIDPQKPQFIDGHCN